MCPTEEVEHGELGCPRSARSGVGKDGRRLRSRSSSLHDLLASFGDPAEDDRHQRQKNRTGVRTTSSTAMLPASVTGFLRHLNPIAGIPDRPGLGGGHREREAWNDRDGRSRHVMRMTSPGSSRHSSLRSSAQAGTAPPTGPSNAGGSAAELRPGDPVAVGGRQLRHLCGVGPQRELMMTKKMIIIAGTSSTASTVTEPASGSCRPPGETWRHDVIEIDRIAFAVTLATMTAPTAMASAAKIAVKDHLLDYGALLVPATAARTFVWRYVPEDGELCVDHLVSLPSVVRVG